VNALRAANPPPVADWLDRRLWECNRARWTATSAEHEALLAWQFQNLAAVRSDQGLALVRLGVEIRLRAGLEDDSILEWATVEAATVLTAAEGSR